MVKKVVTLLLLLIAKYGDVALDLVLLLVDCRHHILGPIIQIYILCHFGS